MSSTHQATAEHTIAVTNPGGLARQFRVQVQAADREWHLHGTFHSREQAEACLQELSQHGDAARLITYNFPAAA